MDVPAAKTYIWAFPTVDAGDAPGGFVKRGAGTLKVGNEIDRDGSTCLPKFAFGHTGRTVVEEGVLDLDGKTWVRGVIGGGAGKFANGTLESARIALDIEGGVAMAVPNFDSTVSFGGVTKVDFGGVELPVGTVLCVATYEGATPPGVSCWRLVNGGERSASFVAQDGQLLATITPKAGFAIIIH